MKKMTLSLRSASALLGMIVFAAMAPADSILSQKDGMDVVNTTSLTADVDGYEGPTPVRIFIRGGKIVRVEALPNDETPEYFARVQKFLLGKWANMPVDKAATTPVDGVTGATYSSQAVIKNVQRGADYYLKNAPKGKKKKK